MVAAKRLSHIFPVWFVRRGQTTVTASDGCSWLKPEKKHDKKNPCNFFEEKQKYLHMVSHLGKEALKIFGYSSIFMTRFGNFCSIQLERLWRQHLHRLMSWSVGFGCQFYGNTAKQRKRSMQVRLLLKDKLSHSFTQTHHMCAPSTPEVHVHVCSVHSYKSLLRNGFIIPSPSIKYIKCSVGNAIHVLLSDTLQHSLVSGLRTIISASTSAKPKW